MSFVHSLGNLHLSVFTSIACHLRQSHPLLEFAADPSSSTYAHGDLDREARPVRRRRRSSSVEDQYATTTGTTAESERGARKWARRDELDVAPPGFRRSSGGSASMPGKSFAKGKRFQPSLFATG